MGREYEVGPGGGEEGGSGLFKELRKAYIEEISGGNVD